MYFIVKKPRQFQLAKHPEVVPTWALDFPSVQGLHIPGVVGAFGKASSTTDEAEQSGVI